MVYDVTTWPSLALLFSLRACCDLEAYGSGSTETYGSARRVVLITCDTLRADHLGCYGYARPTTPNIDAFARESTLYTNAWSAASVTMPSISSVLTGLMPDEIGTRWNQELMPSSVTTLAEVVRDAGFDTAAFVSNIVLARASGDQGPIGVQQGFDHYDDELTPIEYAKAAPERTGAATTRAVRRWLDDRADDQDKFFLWVHYMDPHGPYAPPAEHLAPFVRAHDDEPDLPPSKGDSGLSAIPGYQVIGEERKPGQYVDRYDGEIHAFDAAFGDLIRGLRERGWLEDTLIVFTADHGESLGEHGYWFCHGESLQRELVQVPLLVRLPRASHTDSNPRRARNECAELALQLDVSPTILDALGIDVALGRGTSLLDGELPNDRVAAQVLGSFATAQRRRLAITDGHWRLRMRGTSQIGLFDLASDPGESNNVADAHPEIVAGLRARYDAFMNRAPARALDGMQRKLDDRTRRGLGVLGYTEGAEDEH